MSPKPAPTLNRRGILYALLSYGTWGIFPIYWKGFGSIPILEVISHRLVWSLVILVALAAMTRQLVPCLRALRQPKLLGTLSLTALLLSVNWFLFILGVNTDRVVEASLGYFINPLFSVLLGCIFLRERLSRGQVLAVILAGIGVLYFGYHLWRVPWIALGVAASFGLYGLLRKVVPVDPLPGLVVETALITPVALLLIFLLASRGSMHFVDSPGLTLLFIGGGIVTAVPLLLFISAAKLLPLSAMGFLQYLAPSLQLLTGVLLFHEPFTFRHVISFGFIWVAIGIFLIASRKNPRKDPVEVDEIPC